MKAATKQEEAEAATAMPLPRLVLPGLDSHQLELVAKKVESEARVAQLEQLVESLKTQRLWLAAGLGGTVVLSGILIALRRRTPKPKAGAPAQMNGGRA